MSKVVDFGVAKAVNQRLSQQTIYTHHAQMVGTPLYMSPEQAKRGSGDVDTRSDVYSLGALLYELLAGTTPIDAKVLSSRSIGEMQRMICEVEPPRPSQRLAVSGGAAGASIAGKREISRQQLIELTRRELDWIVMKSLEKSRERRI